MEGSYPTQKDDNAVMEITLAFGSNRCLEFYYNMHGIHMGTLNVRLGNKLIFTKMGPQGKKWLKANIPLRTVGKQTVSSYKLSAWLCMTKKNPVF